MKSINLMKNVGRFTPPKSPSPTYPQIVCMIYPQIVFGDLPSNCLWQFTPPPISASLTYPQIICMTYPQIVFGDLPSNCLWQFTPPPPQNRQVQLTLKSSLAIYSHLSVKCLNI